MARALTGRQDSSDPIGDGTKAGICVLGARCLTWNGRKVTGTRRDARAGAACHGASTMFIGVRSFKDLLGIVIANRRGASPRGLLSGCAALAIVAACSPAGRCATRTPTVMGGAGAAAAALLRPAVPVAVRGRRRPVPARPSGSRQPSARGRCRCARPRALRVHSLSGFHLHLTSGRSPMSQTWRSISAGWRNALVRPHPCGGPRPGWLPA